MALINAVNYDNLIINIKYQNEADLNKTEEDPAELDESVVKDDLHCCRESCRHNDGDEESVNLLLQRTLLSDGGAKHDSFS